MDRKPGRKHTEKDKTSLSDGVLVVLFLLLFGGGWYLVVSAWDQREARQDFSSRTPMDFNFELKGVSDLAERMRLEAALESARNSLRDSASAPAQPDSALAKIPAGSVPPLRLDGRPSELRRLVESTNPRSQDFAKAPASPHELIDSRLARRQVVQDYDRKYRDELVRQFIANARRDGLDPVVDKNLNVVDVRPFRAPINPYRYRGPDSVGPGGSR